MWKNKKEIFHTSGSKDAYAYSVYLVGGYVYVAGDEGSAAKVWRNGEELHKLANDGSAKSIVVHNGDVYVVGYESDGTKLVNKVWKNGKELYTLADKGGVFSIFIAERK